MHFQHFFQHFNGYQFSTRSLWCRAVQLRAPLCSINLGAAADFFQSRQGMVFGDNGKVAISNQLSDQPVKEQVHIAAVLNMNNFVEVYLTRGLSLLDTPEDETTYPTSWKTGSYNLYPSRIFKGNLGDVWKLFGPPIPPSFHFNFRRFAGIQTRFKPQNRLGNAGSLIFFLKLKTPKVQFAACKTDKIWHQWNYVCRIHGFWSVSPPILSRARSSRRIHVFTEFGRRKTTKTNGKHPILWGDRLDDSVVYLSCPRSLAPLFHVIPAYAVLVVKGSQNCEGPRAMVRDSGLRETGWIPVTGIWILEWLFVREG